MSHCLKCKTLNCSSSGDLSSRLGTKTCCIYSISYCCNVLLPYIQKIIVNSLVQRMHIGNTALEYSEMSGKGPWE